MDNWCFNKKFIKNTIDKGMTLLKNPIIPLSKRRSVNNEIYIFNEFLNDNFDKIQASSSIHVFKTIEQLKRDTLKIMEKQYNILGRELIILLIRLNETFEFSAYNVLPSGPNLTIEEQSEETLEMYKCYSETFYSKAKKIILNPTPQIHVNYDLDSTSWGFYSQILDMPLLVIDPSESSSVLTRELQKGLEQSIRFRPHQLSKELGSIYFEMLFNDHMFLKYKIFSKEYYDRLYEFKLQLQQISPYLELVLLFSNYKFKMETEWFLECFNDTIPAKYTDTIKYINDEIISNKMQRHIKYCVSFLKAIELREKTHQNKEVGIEELMNCLSMKKERYNAPESGIVLCQNFSEEVYQKSKKY